MSDNLPNYKQVFIEEMEMLRRKEQEEQEDLYRQSIRDTMQQEAPKPGATHESWNQSQYSDVRQPFKLVEVAHQHQQHFLPTGTQ